MPQKNHTTFTLEDVLAILDGKGIMITDEDLIDGELKKFGLSRSSLVQRNGE